jgi:translation initiation factor 6 (eIF-6)
MTERLQITMTNEKRIGIWGKPNTVYKIVTDENREEAERQIKQTVTVKLTQEELDSLYFCIDEFIEQNRDNTDYNEVLFTHLQNAYSKLIKKVK